MDRPLSKGLAPIPAPDSSKTAPPASSLIPQPMQCNRRETEAPVPPHPHPADSRITRPNGEGGNDNTSPYVAICTGRLCEVKTVMSQVLVAIHMKINREIMRLFEVMTSELSKNMHCQFHCLLHYCTVYCTANFTTLHVWDGTVARTVNSECSPESLTAFTQGKSLKKLRT